MTKKEYKKTWLAFINIKAQPGLLFNDLVDLEDKKIQFKGAWANILVKAETINEAISIIPQGLEELNFKVDFIDKVENLYSLIDNREVKQDVIDEVNWLLDSGFVFKISDKIFPYK